DQPGCDTAHDTQEQQRAEQERENSGQSHDRAGPGPLFVQYAAADADRMRPWRPIPVPSALVQAMMPDQG
ncbi:MAG TPA: hypothetical protein VFO32_05820, partial [Sphingomicrobium sp.]|nr:hypothetical protein [Sphingomicrobium sp.]